MKYVNHMAKFFACVCLFGSTALSGEKLMFGKLMLGEEKFLKIDQQHDAPGISLVDDENDATDFTLSHTHREADYHIGQCGVVIGYAYTISADIIVKREDGLMYSQKGYLACEQGHFVLIANESAKSAQWVHLWGFTCRRWPLLWNPESGCEIMCPKLKKNQRYGRDRVS